MIYTLEHAGVKGMKWGVRRASKKYKSLVTKARTNVEKTSSKRMMDAHNKTADEYNNYKTKKFEASNKNKSEDEYDTLLNEAFGKDLAKNYNRMLLRDIQKDVNYKKAESLLKKYDKITLDSFVKENQASISELKKSLDN